MPRKRSNLPRDLIDSNVRLILRIRDMSQASLAGLMGITPSRVGSILAAPTERTVSAMAKALRVPAEWLTDPDLSKRSVQDLRGERST